MLWKVEFAAPFDLQQISGLGQAIAFPDRKIGADGQQRPFLCSAGSVIVPAVAALFVDGPAKRYVCCLVRLNQRSQFVGRFSILARCGEGR